MKPFLKYIWRELFPIWKAKSIVTQHLSIHYENHFIPSISLTKKRVEENLNFYKNCPAKHLFYPFDTSADETVIHIFDGPNYVVSNGNYEITTKNEKLEAYRNGKLNKVYTWKDGVMSVRAYPKKNKQVKITFK